jgi:hypothetical protein
MQIFISRNFIEFGPLTSSEFRKFLDRGVIIESDFARQEGLIEWWPAHAMGRHLEAAVKELEQVSDAVVEAVAEEIQAEAAAEKKKIAARAKKAPVAKIEDKPKDKAKKPAAKKR